MDAAEVLVIREGHKVGLLPAEGVDFRTHQFLDVLLVGPIDDIDGAGFILLDIDLELVGAHFDNHALHEAKGTLLSSIFSKILRKVPLLLPQSRMKYCSRW
jgi:hypothetical protein